MSCERSDKECASGYVRPAPHLPESGALTMILRTPRSVAMRPTRSANCSTSCTFLTLIGPRRRTSRAGAAVGEVADCVTCRGRHSARVASRKAVSVAGRPATGASKEEALSQYAEPVAAKADVSRTHAVDRSGRRSAWPAAPPGSRPSRTRRATQLAHSPSRPQHPAEGGCRGGGSGPVKGEPFVNKGRAAGDAQRGRRSYRQEQDELRVQERAEGIHVRRLRGVARRQDHRADCRV